MMVGCTQIEVEEINWHERGLVGSSDFISASLNLPVSGSYPVTAYIQDGFVKFQGDILLAETSSQAQATYVSKLWENNTIPYTIHPDISKKVRKHILKAIKTYNKETTLKWIERTLKKTEEDYVEFSPSASVLLMLGVEVAGNLSC